MDTQVYSRGEDSAAVFLQKLSGFSKKNGTFCVKVLVDPEVARYLLAHNPRNRNERPSHSASLASDIKSGNFMTNGETLIVSPDTELVEGRHRCEGVIAAGTPIVVFMSFGIPVEYRTTIGIGQKWSARDNLSASDFEYAAGVAAMLPYMYAYEKHGIIPDGSGSKRGTQTAHQKYARERQQDLEESAAVASQYRPYCINQKGKKEYCLTPREVGAAHRIIRDKTDASAADVMAFFYSLATGEDLTPSNPVLALREMLAQGYKDPARLHRPSKRIAAIFHAWNACRNCDEHPMPSVYSLGDGELPQLER